MTFFYLNNPCQRHFFIIKPEFLKLEFHVLLEFHKLKFKKGERLLNISQIVVKHYIF